VQLHLSVSSASSPGKRGKGSECQERSFELDRRRRQGSEPKACTPGAVTQSLGQASRARRDWTRNLLVVNYERAAGVAAMQWTLVRGGEASCALKSYRGFRAEDVRSNQRSAWLRPWHACSLTGSARNAGPESCVQCPRCAVAVTPAICDGVQQAGVQAADGAPSQGREAAEAHSAVPATVAAFFTESKVAQVCSVLAAHCQSRLEVELSRGRRSRCRWCCARTCPGWARPAS